MQLHIPNVLSAEQVEECRKTLAAAEWTDGKATAGYLSSRVKDNVQLPEGHPVARRLGTMILDALDTNQLFISAALPLKVVPPLFNRYAGGQSYGGHIDGAVRPVFGTPHRVRTDLSATLFLSAPEDYDGGELVVEEKTGERRIKLPAGDMVLYPGTSVHRVQPVTRGERLAAFFWIQSMVREEAKRDILFELDTALQQLGRDTPGHPSLVQIAGCYHNLLRLWSDT
ncbi:MAG TPA: Fe2+-dependent dioxygenase [Micropepsaceae bacterium]|jgi:PKHD-type hydroxylase|nr:Fe2+-dependent dioxygenase [Micropepsaceae bacterium]